MKRLLAISTILLMLATPSFAQKDKVAIEAAIVLFFDGLSELSTEKLKAVTTPDFLLLELGEVWNIDTLLHKMSPMKGVKFERVNRFEFIKTEQSGNTAWVSYHNWADITVNNNNKYLIRWLESAVLVKDKEEWKIKLLHSTEIKPAAARQ
jgi:hypothetical protein